MDVGNSQSDPETEKEGCGQGAKGSKRTKRTDSRTVRKQIGEAGADSGAGRQADGVRNAKSECGCQEKVQWVKWGQ